MSDFDKLNEVLNLPVSRRNVGVSNSWADNYGYGYTISVTVAVDRESPVIENSKSCMEQSGEARVFYLHIPSNTQWLISSCENAIKEIEEKNYPCGVALDSLYKQITQQTIDWEYPGQAVREIMGKLTELKQLLLGTDEVLDIWEAEGSATETEYELHDKIVKALKILEKCPAE